MNNSIKTAIVTVIMAGAAWSGGFVVIANPASSASAIGKADLKRIYNGKIKEWDGLQVQPINLTDGSAVKDAFLKEILGQTAKEYEDFCTKQKITGEGTPPMIQPNSAAVKAMVASIPGAIGYVEESAVDASVKVLAVK
jgi:ABC-type phosphate transport system substrate-binding protein